MRSGHGVFRPPEIDVQFIGEDLTGMRDTPTEADTAISQTGRTDLYLCSRIVALDALRPLNPTTGTW